ncbi:MAG: CRISPR-associated helicase Cas3' [Desulfobacteraceae bacterium]|nr:CRISPR-associated helicase Cas3' [Desulfobacteraceae bacterium]
MKKKILQFYAHSKENETFDKWQTIEDHLKGVAYLSEQFGKEFSSDKFAKISGCFHDLGKYSQEFQNRLINNGEKVDHATAGAQFIYERYGHQFGKLMSYVIAGHHSGLPNGNENETSDLKNRLKKTVCEYRTNIDTKYEQLEITNEDFPFKNLDIVDGFDLSFFIRMVFSCVVDADFLDTERFMDTEKSENRKGYLPLNKLREKLDSHLRKLVDKKKNINIIRNRILQNCLTAADSKRGCFSLTVPTGGGKTFSSLAFALKHAIKNNQRRIIYVIPYTNIIEQNAEVMRSILGDDAVIEHHSNIDPSKEHYRSKLASENWDAPIIVTTNVQFFESLFAYRGSRCRKLHNIANSIVIFDEAQMLPVDLLKPCLRTLTALTKCYNTSIVLCTATQPFLEKNKQLKEGLTDVKEIITEPQKLYNDLKRVKVNILKERVATEVLAEKLRKHEKVLCIVSTKKLAFELFDKISDLSNVYHLSSLMCPVHRSEIIKQIKADLKDKETCRVISTQLIEAGVDIDFPIVYRAIAGIDSIAQAAGRCNREGKLSTGIVNVFFPENGTPPGFLRKSAETAEIVLGHHLNALSLESVEEYFKRLYQDSDLDKFNIIQELNSCASDLDFSFRLVAQRFQMIRNDTKTLIIPWGEEGEKRVDALRSCFNETKDIIRNLQRYTIQIHPHSLEKIKDNFEIIKDEYWVLNKMKIYSKETGLILETETNYETIIV